MKAHEIFSSLSRERALEIFGHIHAEEKELYRATIDSLAKQRKLRPVFLERKPRTDRFVWMKEQTGRKNNDELAGHLLQIWLVGKHSDMLCGFLDGLGIAHDENGTVEDLPEPPPREKLAEVIGQLLEKHDPETVSIYLHAFQAMEGGNTWPPLQELIDSDPRLQLQAASA